MNASICVLVALFGASAAWAKDKPDSKLYVDCGAAPGGDGSKDAPLRTITAALPIAKAASATSNHVSIDVAAGVCNHETFPIKLDFAVDLGGAPDGGTLITQPTPRPASPTAFFSITGPDVTLSRFAVDGQVPILGDFNPGTPPSTTPVGVSINKATGFVVRDVRIARVPIGLRSDGASGRIQESDIREVDVAVGIGGGDPADPPRVFVLGNHIAFRVNGIALFGSGPGGTDLRVVVADNDVTTTFTDTGPTNPALLRVSPTVTALPSAVGSIDVVVENNHFGGTAKYGIVFFGGQNPRRTDGQVYSGSIDAVLDGNTVDDTVVIPSVITFTNIRVVPFPCELDPAIPKGPSCPVVTSYWEYLQGASFDIHQSGELDGVLIDNPEFQPIDGYALDNVLTIDDEVVDYGTFLVIP